MAGMSREEIKRKADKAERKAASLALAKEMEKRPVGRPLEYTPGVGDLLIEIMATGLSVTAAAADIGLTRETIYDWASKYPEFSDALKRAKGKRVLYLERSMLAAAIGPAVTARIFALKNADPEEWRDKIDVEANVKSYLLEVPAEAKSAEDWAGSPIAPEAK